MTPRHFSRRAVGGLAAGGMGALAMPAVLRAQQRIPINIINTQGNATVTVQEMMKRLGFLQEFGIEPKVTYVVDGSRKIGRAHV